MNFLENFFSGPSETELFLLCIKFIKSKVRKAIEDPKCQTKKLDIAQYFHYQKILRLYEVSVWNRDVQKIGPQLWISPILGHFCPKIRLELGVGDIFSKLWSNCHNFTQI